MSSVPDATELLAQLEAFQQHADPTKLDPVTRIKLQTTARKVSVLLEDPVDMTTRIVVQYPAEQMVVRLGADMGLFEILARSEQPQSLPAITSATKANPTFLHRVLRGLGSFGWIRETGNGTYMANPSAAYLANPDSAKGFGIVQDFQFPIYQALPPKAAAESYQKPQWDATDTAASYAYNSRGQTFFDMLMKRPTEAASYAGLMSFMGEHGSLLYDVYPVNDVLSKGFDKSISDVVLVDVGGSWGQKSIAIKKRYPELPGRIIVQDLPFIIANAPPSDLCELTAHDFFQPQPVKHPRAFYMRQTLHNHADSDCVKVISNLKNAMKPGYTKLLLHELVIQERGASNWAVTQDFNMMILLATLERTEAQWRAIVEEAGLKVTKVWSPKDPVSESVIEAELVS